MGLLWPGRKDTDTNLSSIHLHMIANVDVLGSPFLDGIRSNKD